MIQLPHSSRRSLPLLLVLFSVLALAVVPAAAQPIFCDDFESMVPCGWTIGPACTFELCSLGGSCDSDLCSCTPASPFAFLEGDWSGTWQDTIYKVGGSLQATFSVLCGTVQATGIIGMQTFGLGDRTGSGSGTILGTTVTFTFSGDSVGSGSGTLEAGGSGSVSGGDSTGSGDGSVTAPLNYGAFNFSGTVNATTLSGIFDFTSKTGGAGIVTLTKQ